MQITLAETDLLKEIIDAFPYFQSASSMYLKSLKTQHVFYKNTLQEVAAKTIDRSVLFEYIEHNTMQELKAVKKIKPKESQREVVNVVDTSKTNFDELVQSVASKMDEKEENNRSCETEKTEKEATSADKMTYFEWLELLKSSKKAQKNNIFELIDKFLKDKPKIVPVKGKVSKPPVIIEQSVQEKQMLMTETLANLYVNQKKFDKAIQAFKILSLKYPKKSSYFANRIAEIKQNLK